MTRTPLLARLARALRRFGRGQRGSVSVETIVMLPVLVAVLLSMAAFWDGMRARNAALKAATTVSDAISRETAPIDAGYVDRMGELYAFLADARGDTSLRITVVANTLADDGGEKLELRWSAVTKAGEAPVANVDDVAPHIPTIAVGDQVIVVESRVDWTPPLRTPLVAQTFEEVTVSRARFVPQVLWSDG